MKRPIVVALATVLVVGAAVAQDQKKAIPAAPGAAPAVPGAALKPEEVKTKASYGLGLSMGRNFKAQGLELDPELLIRGLRDGLTGAKPQLNDEQIEQALMAFQQDLLAKQAAKAKVSSEKNQQEGVAFLAANVKKPGVQTTKSGLQYKVLKQGAGATPKATDTVKVHYRGSLIDGTVFDSSYERGQPADLPVNQVIPGWTEALQLMKVGSKWQLYIPSDLAYGASPRPGGPIPPNAVLIFDVELLGIQ